MKTEIFRRVESKYLINEKEYKQILEKTNKYLEKDKYFKSEILNIYFDSDNYELIRSSLNKPLYKEKVRIRSYKVPTDDDQVFLEIKKKYDGIVSKRRLELSLKEFKNYYNNNKKIKNSQIMEELDYCFKKYKLKPKLFLSYNRESYKCKDNDDFRITFDYNLKEREKDLLLESGNYGEVFLEKNKYIMEIKSLECMPLWLCSTLSELKIYPYSYSKYGTVYKNKLKEDVINV